MTNIVLMSWLLVVTNTEAISTPISDSEKEFVVRTVEYRTLQFHLNGTLHELPIATNVLSTVTSTLRFDGANWTPGPPMPKPLIQPPLPPGAEAAIARRAVAEVGTARRAVLPQPRFAFPANLPPKVEPLPSAEDLRRAKLWDKHRALPESGNLKAEK